MDKDWGVWSGGLFPEIAVSYDGVWRFGGVRWRM